MNDVGIDYSVNPASDMLLTAAQLKKRWASCSDMLLWRRLRDDPQMPRPLIMCGRRLWYLSQIVKYEAILAARGVGTKFSGGKYAS